jgi:hypothetical protein
MLAIRPSHLTFAIVHHLVLAVFIPMPFKNGAVKIADHLMKNPLQERVTGGKLGEGFFRKCGLH